MGSEMCIRDRYDVAWELRNHHDDISAEEVIALYQKAFDEYDANIEIAV